MGVDFDSVGGIGILVTEEIKEKLLHRGVIAEEHVKAEGWYAALENLLSDFDIDLQEAGDYSYSGDIDDQHLYLLVLGNNLEEINEEALKFLEKLNELTGLIFTFKDLKVISDVLAW